MRRVALVRRRDGEVVPFDETFVVESVHRAMLAAGREDSLLAGEIASVVGLFLEKTYYDEVPTVEQVEDMVEKVLIETGHAAAAKAFILHRERETRLRESQVVRADAATPSLFEPGAVLVDDLVRGTTAPYSREALARALCSDGVLPRTVADDVASSVEGRLRRGGVTRVPWAFVRAVAESELLERGAPIDLRRRGGALLDPELLASAFARRGGADAPVLPAEAARDLGGRALRAHALADVLPSDVARAHLDGDVHVHGLASPTALFSVALSPDALRRGIAPGAGTRGAGEVALSARRLSAALGRTSRFVGAAARNVGINGVAASFAVLLGASRDEFAEEAWNLLFQTSADPGAARIELDLTPGAPGNPETDHGTGETADASPAEAARTAARFADAVLRAHARGTGLPPRESLPLPVVGLHERSLTDGDARTVLRLAAEAALRGERIVFPMLRGDEPVAGVVSARPVASAPAGDAAACAGRATLNLPRAARKAGRGNVEGFLRHCDRLVELAAAAHRARREVLAHIASASGGALSPLFRGARARPSLLSLPSCSWSFGLTGLNEALVHLTGFELHEGDDASARAAQRILSYLALRVREAGAANDFAATLDACEDANAARRLYALDFRNEPDRTTATLPSGGYTPGVGVRRDAPVDPLLRLEREDTLHASLTTATLVLPIASRDAGGPDGVLAVLAKCLRAGRVRQVEVVSW